MKKFHIDLAVLAFLLLLAFVNWEWRAHQVLGFIIAGTFFSFWVLGEQGRAPHFAIKTDRFHMKELDTYLNAENASSIFLAISALGLILIAHFFYLYLGWIAYMLFKVRQVQIKEHIYVEDPHHGHAAAHH
jgi:hypothetical protein